MIQGYDAVMIGGGHNGLACACYLAQAGLKVLVIEQYRTVGGMTLSEELAAPGFISDVHASGYQLASLSPTPRRIASRRRRFDGVRPQRRSDHLRRSRPRFRRARRKPSMKRILQ